MTAYTEIQAYPLGWKIGVGIFVALTFFVIPRFERKLKTLLICTFFLVDAVGVYVVSRKLDTRIDATGIYYKMSPTFIGVQNLTWEQIASVSVGNTPRHDRWSWSENTVYIIGSSSALRIKLENGKSIYLSTQKPAEMNAALIEFSRVRYQSRE